MTTDKFPYVADARFVLGASMISKLGHHDYPEVAVFGRSNVGKSTFINRLANQKQLARTSRTPGRTKEINLFELKIKTGEDKKQILYLADLPGYGFAKVSKKEARVLEHLIEDYLEKRRETKCGCILVDIRRDPKQEELLLHRELFNAGAASIIVATKSDKLSKTEQRKRITSLAKAFHLEAGDIAISGTDRAMKDILERITLSSLDGLPDE